MGANSSFVKDINKAFGQAGQGGDVAGGSPEDWPGSNEPWAGGGPPNSGDDNRDPNNNEQKPKPADAPTIPQYRAPPFYSPRQSQLQKSTYNANSTSHQYLQRFGAATHY